jgi:hypothetical protein
MTSPLPDPPPGHTAALDQLAAVWRDAPPGARAEVEAAAAAVQVEPTSEHIAQLWEALRRAGISPS